MKRALVLILMLSCSILVNGQNLQDLYKTYKPIKNWESKLVIKNQQNPLFNQEQIAHLSFYNKDRNIEFMIFIASDFKDSTSKHLVNNYIIEPYCQAFTTEVFGLSLFTIKGFLFIPKNCPICDFKKDKACKKLAKNILNWHYKINRPASQTKACCKF